MRRMSVDRYVEARTTVPAIRIKIDAEIIFRHHLEAALPATGDYTVSLLPPAKLSVSCSLRVTQFAELARALANHGRRHVIRQACRGRVGPYGERKDVQISKRQGG